VSQGLFDALPIGSAVAANRVVFGPHVTNLGRDRSLSDRHTAYYERRARGGCGVVVTEIASVHESDWPYERAPLAASCARGWAEVSAACAPHGTLVLAGLGHAGMQGSTAWSQDVLWAPSLVPNVHTHEQPLVMGTDEVAQLAAGFVDAAALAVRSGCDGVELNAGQHSLLRQFCSGLTNLRGDDYGSDRSRLLREVLGAVRAVLGDKVLGLRFCADELAPWAGMTPAIATELLCALAADVDYVCVVRGSIYSEAATQPDGHVVEGFNEQVTSEVRSALRAHGIGTPVCAQGSIVDVARASRLLADAACDLVEMTRAQIADPDLCDKARLGRGERIRPCILCNQHCLVRDPRNPIVSCCVNPIAGHELDDAALDVDRDAVSPPGTRGDAVVIGGGIAGMEAARLLARAGHRVRLLEQRDALGGTLRTAARLPGMERLAVLCDWLDQELGAEGVAVFTGREADVNEFGDVPVVVAATGGTSAAPRLRDGDDGTVERFDAIAAAQGRSLHGDVVVLDPIGGPVGIGVVELAVAAGARVTLVTPDVVVGSQLSATGDLVAANARLAAGGAHVQLHAVAVKIADGDVIVEDRFTGSFTSIPADQCVDAGHRLPGRPWDVPARVIGDAIAPRGILAAMLEARRAALEPGLVAS
jgi:2,4-dienoyl-CoA reductase (NADPH2)